jgi:hypothetical protein
MTQYSGVALESKLAAETWSEDFADVLTCYPLEKVNNALLGYFATRKRESEAITYPEMCIAFLDLVDRGVLVAEFKSDLANEGLDEMRTKFAPQTVPSAPAHPPSPANANDYSQMTKVEFEKISTPDARRLYRSNPTFQKRADYCWSGGI